MSNELDRDVRSSSVRIDETGRLVISAVDSGPLVERIFGDSDYEFWYTVAADKVAVLAARIGSTPERIVDDIRTQWRGPRFYELQEILREPEIDASFHSY